MISYLDLFSGAGGLSWGLENAGLKCVGAIEQDRFACETYSTNFPAHKIIQSDVASLSKSKIQQEFSGVELVAGGPPCQGFSVAGPSQYGVIDGRNYLILEFLRYVEILKPKYFILENVKGILSGKLKGRKKALDAFKESASILGYDIQVFLLQAADFGAPQWRERVFIIGSLDKINDLDISLIQQPKFGTNNKPWVTVDEAISDLPSLKAGELYPEGESYTCEAMTDFQSLMRKTSSGVHNHVAMKHTSRLIERFRHIPQGGSLVDVPKEHGQRQRSGSELDVRMRFKMNNQRLSPYKVSTAITASFQSNFVHPNEHRNLTAREGARLQTFPDDFKFKGPRTLMSKKLLIQEGRENEIGLSQYNQIGNSVPPLLAKAVGSIFGEI